MNVDTDKLTERQREAFDAIVNLGDTESIASELGIKPSTVADFKQTINNKLNVDIEFSKAEGKYRVMATDGASVQSAPSDFLSEPEAPEDTFGGVTTNRVPAKDKASTTREVNELLADMEGELRSRLDDRRSVDADRIQRPGHLDMVMFCTDNHFGSHTTTYDYEADEEVVTYDSEIARDRLLKQVSHTVAWKEDLEMAGYHFDNVVMPLNGDLVDGEGIYPSQAHDLDKTLREQVKYAGKAFLDAIKVLSEAFPTVQVICQHGNHGELRTKGASSDANADDLLYDMLELVLSESEVDNVDLRTNHIDTHIEFPLRDHRGYMRHGQDGLGHIGTSSGQQRWLDWLQTSAQENQDAGWDVGYRGHHHELKDEPVAGRKILMGGTPAPPSSFANSMGQASGRPAAWCHTVSDEEAVHRLNPIYFS